MFCLRIAVRIQRNLDSWRSLTHPCMRAKGACNHVARFIVNANHGAPIRLAKLARFFQNSAHMKTTTLPLRNLMNRSPLRRAFFLIPLALGCFALSPAPNAFGVDPPPDGGYPGDNTADGHFALFHHTAGPKNTATGHGALYGNTTGEANTANGANALFKNTTGGNNTANGANALLHITVGSGNIALGASAGTNLRTGNKNIDIGNAGVTGESNTIRIGNVANQSATFIAGISGATVAGGVGVIIDTNGHLGTVVSSERFKDSIKPMDKASEAILALKPVTFRYKKELDAKGIPQSRLVAEQVEKVNPNLVVRDAEGKVYAVRYEAVNAMLLNEFLKQHNEFIKEHRTVQGQQKEIDALRAELKE